MTFVDPVAQPSEYQTLLLSFLGDQDPADVQARTPTVLADLVHGAGDLLRTRPAPNEWSVLELVGHLFDAELVVAGRYRWIIAHDEPTLAPYDQDLWVQGLRHNEGDPDELLAAWNALRQADLRLWGRSSSEERARVGMHEERGPESFDLTFRLLSGHDLFHIDQIERTLGAVRSG